MESEAKRIRKIALSTKIMSTGVGTGRSCSNGENVPLASADMEPFGLWMSLTGDMF